MIHKHKYMHLQAPYISLEVGRCVLAQGRSSGNSDIARDLLLGIHQYKKYLRMALQLDLGTV